VTPLQPLVPLNILNGDGDPLRNDDPSTPSYVGSGNGTQPPETYYAYHPNDPNDRTPIYPGKTTVLKNQQTNMFCRLAPPPGPVSKGREHRTPAGTSAAMRPPPAAGRSKRTSNASGTMLAAPFQAASVSCTGQVVLCDQPTPATATVLTYTGSGLSYNGVPLAQTPVSRTLMLSADPACRAPGGDSMTFPPGRGAGCD
jgi:hypothetical protein